MLEPDKLLVRMLKYAKPYKLSVSEMPMAGSSMYELRLNSGTHNTYMKIDPYELFYNEEDIESHCKRLIDMMKTELRAQMLRDKDTLKVGDVLHGVDKDDHGWWYGTVIEEKMVRLHESDRVFPLDGFEYDKVVGNVNDDPSLAELYSNHMQIPLKDGE